MLLALSGITGVGKSYFTEIISKELEFNKVNTIRTRKMRKNEVNGKSGIFVTNEELDKLKEEGKIAYDFSVFGGRYAYLKEEVLSDKNYIFEMHYTMIDDWKKIVPDIKTIYMFPNDINIPKEKLKDRNLSAEQEKERLQEIEEQYNKVYNDEEFKNKFDYIFYNNYTEESKEKLLNIVKNMLGEVASGK